MSSPAASRGSRNILARFRRNRRGSAAVEFALVAPVFFALLFAILESGILFFASQVLESVAQNAARQILTGQAQKAGLTQTTFASNVVCPPNSLASVLFTCSNISIDVESYSAFANITLPNRINSGAFDNTGIGYSPGGPGDIVVVQLFYQWQQIVTGLGYNVSNLNGSKRLLTATAAFRNEPY
jgi:Flp pilus assembly protein TadG